MMFHIHKWILVRDTGVHEYQICQKCGKRRIERVRGGYQPVDTEWVRTGEWSKRPQRPTTGLSVSRS